jgi:hypothetical protein
MMPGAGGSQTTTDDGKPAASLTADPGQAPPAKPSAGVKADPAAKALAHKSSPRQKTGKERNKKHAMVVHRHTAALRIRRPNPISTST